MALGTVLKEARERKGMTPLQVAESTRMLVQIVHDLECEDFSRIAASLYGRGFIKLYAECVGANPEPLVAEFMDIYTGKQAPQILRRVVPPAAVPVAPKSAAPQTQVVSSPVSPLAVAATPKSAETHPQAEPLPAPPNPVVSAAPKPAAPQSQVEPSPASPQASSLVPEPQRLPIASPQVEEACVKPPPSAVETVLAVAKTVDPQVMPLDSPADASPDLFSLAQEKESLLAKPAVSLPVDGSVPVAAPPRVRPFSGQSVALDLAPDALPEPIAVRPPPKRTAAPVWTKTRVVVREVVKIWSGVPRLPAKWLTPRRLALLAGTAVGVLIVLLGIYALKKLAERPAKLAEQSESRTIPGLSERALPPPVPYIE